MKLSSTATALLFAASALRMKSVVLALVITTVVPAFAQLPEDFKRQFDGAERRIVRLPPTSFPELPRVMRT